MGKIKQAMINPVDWNYADFWNVIDTKEEYMSCLEWLDTLMDIEHSEREGKDSGKNSVKFCDKAPQVNPVEQYLDEDTKYDSVSYPKHYQLLKGVEAIDIIDIVSERFDGRSSYYIGNTLKYLLRAGMKWDAIEDLKKASTYLDWLIESESVEPKCKGVK